MHKARGNSLSLVSVRNIIRKELLALQISDHAACTKGLSAVLFLDFNSKKVLILRFWKSLSILINNTVPVQNRQHDKFLLLRM